MFACYEALVAQAHPIPVFVALTPPSAVPGYAETDNVRINESNELILAHWPRRIVDLHTGVADLLMDDGIHVTAEAQVLRAARLAEVLR